MSPGWPARLVHGHVVVRPLEAGDSRAWREVRGRNAEVRQISDSLIGTRGVHHGRLIIGSGVGTAAGPAALRTIATATGPVSPEIPVR